MYKILDYDNSRNSHYKLTDEIIKKLGDRKSDFSYLINESMTLVVRAYKKEFPVYFYDEITHASAFLGSEQIKDQIQTELLQQMINFLSINTSKHITYQNFPADITENSTFPFMGERTFQKFMPSLTQIEDRVNITKYQLDHPEILYYQWDAIRENLLLEKSPLSEFIFSHIYLPIKVENQKVPLTPEKNELFDPDSKERQKFLEKSMLQNIDLPAEEYFHLLLTEEETNANSRYLFNKEGKFFLASLFNIIHNHTKSKKASPYVCGSLNKLSLTSINYISETLYESYSSEAVKSDDLESYLFFVNAENIYHPSWNKNIFTSFRIFTNESRIHSGSKQESLLINNAIQIITALENLPLNSLKIYFWNTYFAKCLSPDIHNYGEIKYSPVSVTTANIVVNLIQEMTNCFYHILLKSYDCYFSEEILDLEEKYNSYKINDTEFKTLNEQVNTVLENMSTLKTETLKYLNSYKNYDISWSILDNIDLGQAACPSSGADYLDYLLSYSLYIYDDSDLT